MVVGIKTSLNIKLRHTVGMQTLTMLMNAPCSLIMSRGERSFLLAIFLMKYCWKWVLVHGVPLQRIAKETEKIKNKNLKKMKGVLSLVHVIYIYLSCWCVSPAG